MILHTLNALPSSSAFQDCVRIIRSGDALVLLGDGVYAAIASTQACASLLTTGARIYVLATDAAAAGITTFAPEMETLDMDGFVALTEEFPRHQAWY